MNNFDSSKKSENAYLNIRTEFVEALKSAGFSSFAMANPYNVCVGAEGIYETEEFLKSQGIVVSGIGENKNPIVDINGIKVAFLSYAVNCINKANVISDEGSAKLLNEYRASRFSKDVEGVKNSGAEFVLVYANCGTEDDKYDLEQRKKLAEEMAQLGADYVICTVPKIISKYYKFKTDDGRIVPIATSVGNFICGKQEKNSDMLSALIKVTLRKTFDGKIEVYDNFIPLKIFKEFRGIQNSVMPAQLYFNIEYKTADYKNVKTALQKKLGDELPLNQERSVKMKTYYNENFTVEELYDFLGVTPSSEDLKRLGDKYKKYVSCIVSRKPDLKKNCVAVLGGFDGGYQKGKIKLNIKDAVSAGAVLVIDKVKHKELPTIVVKEDIEFLLTKIAASIRDRYNPLTVAITGSVGKTTTKELMSRVFDTHYKGLHIDGNNNTIYTTRQVVQKLDKSDEFYIQEVHGGSKRSASKVSKLIKPNIAVITSIGQAHLGQMGSMEEVIKGKMEIADGLQENGVLIINDDNEHLHNQKPNVKTIRYSSYNEECDYYAKDVVVYENEIYFKIVSKGGEFDELGVYDAKLNIQGEHNVQNAVGVFAASRRAGIPPHKIIAGLASYRTEGVRQNIINVGGIKLLVDIYSSNPISLLSAVKTLDNLQIENGGRRIAVVGELPDQGEISKEVHYKAGKDISKYNFDILLCIGPDSEYIAEAAKEEGREAYFFKDRETFNTVLAGLVKPGDAVLFKASTRYGSMEELTITPIFGDISH